MSSKLEETLKTLEALAKRKRFRAFDYFVPYDRQRQFFDLGATKRERLFMAGTQVGKTHAGAFEATCHATGEYPPDWRGKKFTKPTRGWVAGITAADVRGVAQKKLCGTPGVTADFGTGMIPKELFVDTPSLARGVTDAYDTIQVQHKTNGKKDGISTIQFKSYEQGRKKFQGDTIDWGWGDEEAEEKGDSSEGVYDEFLSRLTGDGILFTTFTPLFGRTKLVESFFDGHADRGVVTMDLDDAKHFTPEERAKRLAGYKPHERAARKSGTPKLGSGAIFITSEEQIIIPTIEYIPPQWYKIWGMDFGIGHPFAATLLLWDKDTDTLYVAHSFKMQGDGNEITSVHHAQAVMKIGANVPVAWPQDGTQREKTGGDTIATTYRKHNLLMLPDHATWPEGGVSVEAGIKEWDEREKSGRLKVFAHLSSWLEERRFYHRKDGLIVKMRDDELSATRYALMMKRFSKQVQLGGVRKKRKKGDDNRAEGWDFDPLDV